MPWTQSDNQLNDSTSYCLAAPLHKLIPGSLKMELPYESLLQHDYYAPPVVRLIHVEKGELARQIIKLYRGGDTCMRKLRRLD